MTIPFGVADAHLKDGTTRTSLHSTKNLTEKLYEQIHKYCIFRIMAHMVSIQDRGVAHLQ